jgi:diamine N-acetyltransferase
MIQLKEITKTNYRTCVGLETTEEQKSFVAPNWYSLLKSLYEEKRQAFAIYHQEEMIGFLMFSYYEADEDYPKESWWIERFMIDQKFQKQGYGTQALQAAIDWFQGSVQGELRISAVKGNQVAKQMYEKHGFVATGEVISNEIVLLKR